MKIAHIRPDSDKSQSIKEHSYAAAEMAQQFAVEPLKQVTYITGLLHDIGKYQDSFQKKILYGKKIKVEHSICGAIETAKLFGRSSLTTLIQYCIAGHHSGIPDGGTQQDTADDTSLYGRLKRTELLEDYSDYRSEISADKPDENELKNFLKKTAYDNESLIESFAFVTRYCFSCLTDADSLDTAYFCNGRKDIELTSDFGDCLKKLDCKMSSFKTETPLQKSRSLLQEQVYEKVRTDSEIYLMNMPTGSGKTLCSMKFALMRAMLYSQLKTFSKKNNLILSY